MNDGSSLNPDNADLRFQVGATVKHYICIQVYVYMYICMYTCLLYKSFQAAGPCFFPHFFSKFQFLSRESCLDNPPIEVQACCFSKQLQRGIKTLEEMMDRKVRNPAKDGKDVVLDEIKI